MSHDNRTGLLLVCLVLALGLVYGSSLLRVTDGRLVAPFDDAYIHFQYARQVTLGQPWQYNQGDPFSTGSSSPLYPFILALGMFLGFSGEKIVLFTWFVGGFCMALSGWLVHRTTGRLLSRVRPAWRESSPWVPTVSAALLLLTGAVQWNYWNGMETALYTLAALGAYDVLCRQEAPDGKSAVQLGSWLSFACLLRPDGLVLAGVLMVILFVNDRREGRKLLLPSPGLAGAAAAVLIGLAPLALNWALTGSPMFSGAASKSWLGNIPFRPADILASIGRHTVTILIRFVLGYPYAPRWWYVAPAVLPLAIVGWGSMAIRRQWRDLSIASSWFAAGILATSTLTTAPWFGGRYQVPSLALLFPSLALGTIELLNLVPGRWRRAAAAVTASLMLGLSFVSTWLGYSEYLGAVKTVANQQLAIADWVRENTPRESLIGITDAGAIRYVGERPTIDLIGLTTPAMTLPWRHGPGGIYEALERQPIQPGYFATYPDIYIQSYLAQTDLFGRELYRATVPDYGIASPAPTQAVYAADWRLAESGEQLYQGDVIRRLQGLREIASIDLADLVSEEANGISWWEGEVRPGFPTDVQQLAYHTDPIVTVLDGGRLLTGGLSFPVDTPGRQPLTLVARLHSTHQGSIGIYVDDQLVGHWRYPALAGEWLETTTTIDLSKTDGEDTDRVIRLEVEPVAGEGYHLSLYHLWVFEGTPAQRPAEYVESFPAVWDGQLTLLGYDLPTVERKPGERIPLTLYWRTEAGSDRDAKVFVHLYDQAGEIKTQADGYAYLGTRPPYSWAPGEVIVDPRELVLPPDLPPGSYRLAVGLYDPADQTRLPAEAPGDRLMAQDRVLLQAIELGGGD